MPGGEKRFLFKNIALIGPSGDLRENRDILVEDGRIISIGHAGEGEAGEAAQGVQGVAAPAPLATAASMAVEVYDGRGKLALPGFYNLHCHVPMTLLRGYGEGLPLKTWLFERVFPFEALLTEEDCYWGSLLGIAEMLASGTVSFSDMYLLTPGIARAVRESGIKANLSHGYSTAPGSKDFTDSRAYEGSRFLVEAARADRSGRLVADAAVHAEYTFGEERFGRQIAEFCLREGLRLQIHLSETKDEHEACKARRGGLTPTAFFDSCGLFGAPTVAAHGVWLEDRDLDIFAERGISLAHCPASNLKLASGIAPVQKILDRGIRVCLGTDGAASNNNLNLLREATLASLLQKGITGNPLALGPARLLEMACENGALAQGRQDCGALEEGKKADIIVFDLESPRLRPVYDPLVSVFHAADRGDVVLAMVDGRVLYKNGEFTSIDIARVLAETERIRGEKLATLEGKR
jgi:5-methylthioadenosine/S-adenosylhomocysteine deaminase